MHRPLIVVAFVFGAVAGCGRAPESSSAVVTPAGGLRHVQTEIKPDITTEKIMKDIVGRVVRISDVRGTLPSTQWTFEASEFRQADIIEKKLNDNRYTLVVFMTTRNNHKEGEDDVQVSGRLLLHYEWRAGQWVLTRIENLTFRYSLGQST